MITTLLILHGLMAVALLGALTHQALAVCWPSRNAKTFVAKFRAVSGPSYTNAVVVLFVLTMILGGMIYPTYRTTVRIMLEDYRMYAANGSFELKEHFAAIGLGLLPAYWYYWRQPLAEKGSITRTVLTVILAFVVWWGFLVGHILSNIRGFGT